MSAPLWFDVISNSMSPTIRRGDQVRIRPLEPGEPLPGQVLAFQRGMLITHRYLGQGRCRGDNTIAIDNAITSGEMVGIVVSVKRDGVEAPVLRHSKLRMALHYCRLLVAHTRRRA